MSELTIKQRILQALREYNMEPKDLGEGNPSKSRKMRRQIEEDTELTESTLSEILNRFPDLSAEWLLRGNGAMLISQPQHETHTRDIRDDSDVIHLLREQIDYLKQNNTDLREEVKNLKQINEKTQSNLSDALYSLKLEQQKILKKRIRSVVRADISPAIEEHTTNAEYEEFIKFLKTNPDPLLLRCRIDIFLDEIGTDLEELSLSFGIEPKEAEQELEKNVSDISPEVLDMIKETYRERGNEVVHDTSITMDKLKRKYKAQALTIKHANEQI